MDIIKCVVPDILIASFNLFKSNQFTFRLLPVVVPYSIPASQTDNNSLSSNNSSGNSGSKPERVSYILHAPYILFINFGEKPNEHAP